MTDKNTQKEINKVIKKYAGETNASAIRGFGTEAGIAMTVGMSLDFILTGGVFSGFTILAANTTGLMGLFFSSSLLDKNLIETKENTATQSVRCNAFVLKALKQMESSLRTSFNKAALPDATPDAKTNFRDLAAEIEQDVRTLSPAFKIVSDGSYGFGTERYEFIVAERRPELFKKELVTTSQALEELGFPVPRKQKFRGGFEI